MCVCVHVCVDVYGGGSGGEMYIHNLGYAFILVAWVVVAHRDVRHNLAVRGDID